MNLLILGSGGREHTFAWKLTQSRICDKLFIAPGNAGTASLATNVPLAATDFPGIAQFVLKEAIGLVIVGPEEPLVKGIRDYFAGRPDLKHVKMVGPDAAGARMEGSKDWSKGFMQKYAIPTAGYATFTLQTLTDGLQYLRKQNLPVVLKADGLAAGKGVVIAQSHAEAEESFRSMLNGQFGEASRKVVIEEYLEGIELSVFVLTDGNSYKILPEAKDYKRIGEGDTGPNTGGMGAISPVPFADEHFIGKVEDKIIRPTINGLRNENIQYIGFIFIGLMNVHGEPYVIEYNARMGDPETEVVLPRLKTDLGELLLAAAEGRLAEAAIEADARTAATVMLVSGGYPEAYEKGKVITGTETVQDVLVFHAGTKSGPNGLLTDGGRVMTLTGLGNGIEDALGKARRAAEKIHFENKYYRKDIGLDLLKIQAGLMG